MGNCIKKFYFHWRSPVPIYIKLMPFIQDDLYLYLLEVNIILCGCVQNYRSDWFTEGSEFSLLKVSHSKLSNHSGKLKVCLLFANLHNHYFYSIYFQRAVSIFFSPLQETTRASLMNFILKADLYCQAHTEL